MRSQPKKQKAKKARKPKKPNPLSPRISDSERARLLKGRRVVQVNDKGEREVHLDVVFHKYLPRGKISDGGFREHNLLQIFTSEGKQTIAIREITEVR